jgi:pimeloyl-ACP methyl ester carboxylesterase
MTNAHDRPTPFTAGCRIAIVFLAAIGFLTACAGQSRRVEAPARRPAADRIPVVLLPGIAREVNRVLFGAPFVSGLALRTDTEALASLGDPRFPADGGAMGELAAQVDRALRGTDVRGLQGLIDRLVRDEGYVRGDPAEPHDKDYPENDLAERQDRARVASLFVLYYDWRRDLSASACFVAERVARIRAATGAPRIVLVGHSLGGVVARYYLRHGGRDAMRDRDCTPGDGALAPAVNAAGAASVGRLVVMGAPHRGSAQAFRALIEDVTLFGLLRLGVREAIFTLPQVWQLLPFAEADGRVPLLLDRDGEERISLYALPTWLQRGWVPGNGADPARLRFAEAMLARAVAFQRSMTGRHPAEESVPRFVIGGRCRPTLARAVATNGRVEFLSRGQSGHPLFARSTAPGDGVVTAESALGLPPSPTLTLLDTCAGHNGYLDDPDLAARIIQFLLRTP